MRRMFDLGMKTDGSPILLTTQRPEGAANAAWRLRHESLAKSFRAVLADSEALEHTVIAVSNNLAGAGAGHVAAGLAMAATSFGKKVILVSAHIEPIAGLAAEEVSTGVRSVLGGKETLADAAVTVETPNGDFTYLAPGPIDPVNGLLDEHEDLARLIEDLEEGFDLVILELPSVLDNPLAARLVEYVGISILCTAGKGSRRRVELTESVLRAIGAEEVYRVHLGRPQPRPILVRPAALNAQVEVAASEDDPAMSPRLRLCGSSSADGQEQHVDALVTVVIPCRNEEHFIDAVLDSVQAQTYENLEILVVDGLSDDRTVELVERRARFDQRMAVVSNPDQIVSPGLNRALAVAKGRWFVRIDAHCVIPSDYVERVVGHLQKDTFGSVGGLKIGVGRTRTGRAIAAAMASPVGVGNSTYHHGDHLKEVEHLPFGAYPVELARELGGWDEAVLTNQDFEFDHRIGLSGRPLLFDPEIVIHWHCRQSIPDLFRQYRRYGRGKSVVCRLHPESIRPRHLLPAAFVAGLVLLAAPSPLWPAQVAAAVSRLRALTAISYLCVLLGGASTAVQPDPKARPLTILERCLVPVAFVTMHVGQGVGFWTGLFGFGNEHAVARSGAGSSQRQRTEEASEFQAA